MGRNKIPITVVISIGIVAGLLTAGCLGGSSTPVSHKPELPKVRGTVDLDRLVESNPAYTLIRQADAELAARRTQLDADASSVRVPNIKSGLLLEAEQLRAGSAVGYSEADLKRRLDESAANSLKVLTERLEKSKRLAQSEAVADAVADGESRFNTGRDKIESEYQNVWLISPDDPYRRINLKLAIGALLANIRAANANAAASRQWESMVAKDRADLAQLDVAVVQKVQAAKDEQNKRVEQLRLTVHQETASRISRNEVALNKRMAVQLSDYTALLSERREAILETANQFDRQMVSALESGAEKPAVSETGVGSRLIDPAVCSQWQARLSATKEHLAGQRQRQLALLREETLRTVLEVAKRKNLLIVGWRSTPTREDLTIVVLKDLHRQGWVQ